MYLALYSRPHSNKQIQLHNPEPSMQSLYSEHLSNASQTCYVVFCAWGFVNMSAKYKKAKHLHFNSLAS